MNHWLNIQRVGDRSATQRGSDETDLRDGGRNEMTLKQGSEMTLGLAAGRASSDWPQVRRETDVSTFR